MLRRWLPDQAWVPILLLALSFSRPILAAAQTGDAEGSPGNAGAYQISVEEFLSNISLGRAGFAVTVREAATGRPVPDARVVVGTSHEPEGRQGWATALNSPVASERYVA